MHLRFVLLTLALSALTTSVARAQHPTVEGTAFVDRNGNGTRDAGEPGLAGVVVSNQDAVVVTDAAGAFRIARGPSDIVFVSVPDGYRAVKSFWRSTADAGAPLAFALAPVPRAATFTFVHASDTHIAPASLPRMQRFRAIVDSVRPSFVLVAGDLVRDALRVGEAEATSYYEMFMTETRQFTAPVWTVPGNHENFGIERDKSHVSASHPLYGRGMYHHYLGPDYYSFTAGGVHFVGLNSVDFYEDQSYYGHVDSLQLAWLERDLAHVPPNVPVVTFNHIPLVTSQTSLAGYTDDPPAPTIITVRGRTLLRHTVSNVDTVLTLLRQHRFVLALGAHIHAAERIVHLVDGVQTRFEQSAAVVGPSQIAGLSFPSGVTLYTVRNGQIDAGRFIPLDRAGTTP